MRDVAWLAAGKGRRLAPALLANPEQRCYQDSERETNLEPLVLGCRLFGAHGAWQFQQIAPTQDAAVAAMWRTQYLAHRDKHQRPILVTLRRLG